MTTPPSNPPPDDLDAALSRRLARLRETPIDTSSLESRLLREMGHMDEATDALESEPRPVPVSAKLPRRRTWFWPVIGFGLPAAAALLIGIFLVLGGGSEAIASTDLARMHREIDSPQSQATPVASIEEANSTLARQWPQCPMLPATDHARPCSTCVHCVGRCKVACAKLKYEGSTVTLVVGPSSQFVDNGDPTAQVNGRRYLVRQSGGLNMVMTQERNPRLCLVSDLPQEKLLELAGKIGF